MYDQKAIVKFKRPISENEKTSPERVTHSDIERFANSASLWPSNRAVRKKAKAHVQEIRFKKMETEKEILLAHMETGALAILEECQNQSDAIKAKVGHQITAAAKANMEIANSRVQSAADRAASESHEYRLNVIERFEAGLLPESEANRLIELEYDRAQKLVEATEDLTQLFLDGLKSAAKKRVNKLYNGD
ncbi:MAG: hypothetical protein LBF38_06640 [Deltaproteobacteria bacterium]|jgi:hypothetical protein|nr:hypothetical protein [Deltaproteobacteria bacterium]